MCLPPQPSFPVPEETRRVAQAAFPKGTLCLQSGAHLGTLYHAGQFTALFRRMANRPKHRPGWR